MLYYSIHAKKKKDTAINHNMLFTCAFIFIMLLFVKEKLQKHCL